MEELGVEAKAARLIVPDEGHDADTGIDADAIAKVFNYIKKVEIMVLTKADDKENRDYHDSLFTSMEGISARLKRIENEGGANVKEDDIKRWNDNVTKTNKVEIDVDKLMKMMTALNVDQIKSDLSELKRAQLALASKAEFDKLAERLRKDEEILKDNRDEIFRNKDLVNKLQDIFEDSQKKHKEEFNSLRARIDQDEQQIAGLKKLLTKLAEQNKELMKQAATGGNPMASSLLKDLEEKIQKLEEQVAALKEDTNRNF